MPAVEGADEGEFADALVGVVAVKDRKALLVGKAGVMESFDEGGEFVAREERFRGDRQGAKVEDSAVHTTFAAGAGDGVKKFFTGIEVEVLVGPEADEVGRADDLEV